MKIKYVQSHLTWAPARVDGYRKFKNMLKEKQLAYMMRCISANCFFICLKLYYTGFIACT